jgi:hypothetical protein
MIIDIVYSVSRHRGTSPGDQNNGGARQRRTSRSQPDHSRERRRVEDVVVVRGGASTGSWESFEILLVVVAVSFADVHAAELVCQQRGLFSNAGALCNQPRRLVTARAPFVAQQV